MKEKDGDVQKVCKAILHKRFCKRNAKQEDESRDEINICARLVELKICVSDFFETGFRRPGPEVMRRFRKLCKFHGRAVDCEKLKDNEDESMWAGKARKRFPLVNKTSTKIPWARNATKELLWRNKVTKWTLQMEKYRWSFCTRIRQRDGILYWCQKYRGKFSPRWKKNIDKKCM